jgi:hypothetical protein
MTGEYHEISTRKIFTRCRFTGVAPDAEILAYKVFTSQVRHILQVDWPIYT